MILNGSCWIVRVLILARFSEVPRRTVGAGLRPAPTDSKICNFLVQSAVLLDGLVHQRFQFAAGEGDAFFFTGGFQGYRKLRPEI